MMKREVINLIYNIRGTQVMLDSDPAALFEVETKVFNQAVKRNIERFPDTFRFQLSKEEYDALRSQVVTSSLNEAGTNHLLTERIDLRSQNVTSSVHGGRRYLPYAFTEQGVAMLTGLLRSDIATQMSIRVMNAFVEMRKFITENGKILNRLDNIENKLLSHINSHDRFEQLFNAFESKQKDSKEKIFFQGQIYDAYSFLIQLVEKADSEILLIDNYIENSVLDMLSKKKKGVNAKIVTHSKTKILPVDIQKFNQQYPTLSIIYSDNFHDRFLLIDKKELYHVGASLKDLGKKCFAVSMIEDKELIRMLLNR